MKYSIIVPVFNRPDEVSELLESLTHQTVKDFEVIIVEDGSKIPCKEVCDAYKDKMDIQYFFKENSGPGQSRNYGAERASGEYLLILDSDVVLPENYLKAVNDELSREPADAFGQGTFIIYRYPKGYILLHDIFFHHRWYPWRQKEDG